MKKSFLLCSLLLPLLVAAPSIHAVTLKIATLAPAGTTWMKLMKKGGKEIQAKTEGRVKLKFYPGGVMGNDQSVHRKIRINQLHGGAFSSSGLSQVDSSIQALSLPMLFRSFEEVDFVRATIDDRIKQHVAKNGFIVLGITEGGFARIMSSLPIRNLEDIRGSKVWIPEGDVLVEETYNTLGITPIPLPIADVFTGLQTGLIETIAATSTGAIALQWHSKLTHMVDTPVLYVIGLLAVSEKAFSRLKPADQQVVIEEMNRVFKEIDRINRQDNLDATAALKSQGITSITPPEAETERWRQLSLQSIDNMVNSGMIDRQIVEEINGLLEQFRKQ